MKTGDAGRGPLEHPRRWMKAGPRTGSAELPRAARHTLRRRRSRAGALPRGSTFDRAGRAGAGEVAVLRGDLGAVGELAGAEGDVERARAHVDVTSAGRGGRGCRGVRTEVCGCEVGGGCEARERKRERATESWRASERGEERRGPIGQRVGRAGAQALPKVVGEALTWRCRKR